MEHSELIKKVVEYFERTRTDSKTEQHEPEEVGYWVWRELKKEEIPEIYHGKFSGAVAQAVQSRDFNSKGIVRKVHTQGLQEYNIPNALLRDYAPVVEYE